MTNYLGIVNWGATGNTGRQFAQLRPLFRSDENPMTPNEQIWYQVGDTIKEFPNRGYVTWYESPPEALRNTVWQFNIEQQPYDPHKTNHDAFKVRSPPYPPTEIIDVRQIGDAESVRQQLTHEGLKLSFIPSKYLYAWVQDKNWVAWIGPLHLIHAKEADVWRIDPAQLENPLMCFLPAPDAYTATLNINGQRLFLSPGVKRGARIGQIDWSADATVLKRVIQRQQGISPTYKNDLRYIIEQFSNNGLIGTDSFLEQQRLQRARAIASELLKRQEPTEVLIEGLLKIPSIESQLNDIKTAIREQTESQVRFELAEEASQVEMLKAEKARLREEFERLGQECDDQRTALEEQIQTHEAKFEVALKERLASLMLHPERVLADIAIFRAVMGLDSSAQKSIETTHQVEESIASFPSSEHPSSPLLSGEEKNQFDSLDQPQQMRQSLRNALKVRNLSSAAARPLHSAFLSGAVPILVGDGSLNALEAYASCVTGGRVLWLPISATTLEPNDLFGKVAPATGRFVPQAGGLIDLLMHANTKDDLYLVILDGINRAAVDAYLNPIISCYTEAWQGEMRRALPLFHPKALSSNDPYSSAAWLKWPPNVLLAGVLTEGVAIIPPSPAFWGSTVLLHLGMFGKEYGESQENQTNITADTTLVSRGTWRQWRQIVSPPDSGVRPQLKEFFERSVEANLHLRPESIAMCARIYASAQTWTNEDRALEDAVIHCIVPQAVTTNQDGALFETLNQMQKMSERVETAVRLAREVLL